MNFLQIILLLLFFIFLGLFLSSFLFYIPLHFSALPFFILFILLYNIVEGGRKENGYYVALIAGLVLDFFTIGMPLGFYALILLIITYFIKLTLKKYVGISAFS